MILADYPSVPPPHPWSEAEMLRQSAIGLWRQGKLPEANAAFVSVLRSVPLFPFGYSTYHRFLHSVRQHPNVPHDPIVTIPETQWFAGFQMYRFFGRCQVAHAVATGGWNGFETPCPLVLAKWLRAMR